VVINTSARESLSRRTGIAATVVPNVIDFHRPPPMDMDAARSFRDHIGARSDDLVFLQPTRVVQRKGIEHAIHLVRALERPGTKLVVSHQAGDEGYEYAEWLERYAGMLKVDLVFVDSHMDDPWGTHSRRFPEFTLYDIYPGADFVTYPSLCEGFGNGLLEAIYFKRPVMVNRYATYVRDIEPLGFDLVSIDGFLTTHAVARVNQLLDEPHICRRVTEANFQIAKKHFSYETLAERINFAMSALSVAALLPKLGIGDADAAVPVPGERRQRMDMDEAAVATFN
jgi:glycosyltransferase involved in cell wall biosynthesis